MCLIKLSISHRNTRQAYSLNKEVSYILQAIILLEYAWSHSKSNFQLSLLLVRLYTFLGCGSQAMKAFQHLALKQIQLDTLSYILLDRISSLHPLPFTSSPDGSSENLSPLQYLQKQQKVYRKARVHVIQNRWKAFENGSYNSIFQFQEFSEHITRTLSAGTSVIESRKISRILQAKVPDEPGYDILPQNPEKLAFPDTNDYASFPNFEASSSQPFEKLSRFAPVSSINRCQANLIVEKLISIIDPTPNFDSQDNTDLTTYSDEPHSILAAALKTESAETGDPWLTSTERLALEAYLSLSNIIVEACDSKQASPSLDEHNISLCEKLDKLVVLVKGNESSHLPFGDALHTLYTFHELGSVIVKAAKYISQPTNRAAKSQIAANPKLAEQAKKLMQAVADISKLIKSGLDESGWIDRVLESVLGEESTEGTDLVVEKLKKVVNENFLEEWAGGVVESWRDAVTGLSYLKVH